MKTTKTWTQKLSESKPVEIKKTEKKFADIPENSMMLIASPQILNDFICKIPANTSMSLKELRSELAKEHKTEYSCPVTTGIFLRIVAEAAYENLQEGKEVDKITPFWRVIEPKASILTKLSFGSDFVLEQRKKEGLSTV